MTGQNYSTCGSYAEEKRTVSLYNYYLVKNFVLQICWSLIY